jgi:hypothetical protein
MQGRAFMARLISSKDAELARKYCIGIPDKKISFISSRQLISPAWLSDIKTFLTLLFGFCCCGIGLYLLMHTTMIHDTWSAESWILTLVVASVPLLFGYVMQLLGKKCLVSFNMFAALIGLCMMTLYTSISHKGSIAIDPSLYLLDGLFLNTLAIFLLWRCYQALKHPLALLLYTEGCIVVYQWRRIQVLRWDSVTSVWNTPLSTRFICKNGVKLTIAHHWPKAIVAREIICGKVLRHIRLNAAEMFASGATVPFGTCTLSQKGIFDGVQTFPWNNIYECEYMDNGVALIGKDRSRLAHVSTTNLPNIAVFVALVNTIAHDRTMLQIVL